MGSASATTCPSRRAAAPLALAALALALLACCSGVEAGRALTEATTTSSRRDGFDFFFLVRQWPATFCNDHSCTHQPPRRYAFTVHGLWPQRRDGTWPEFCDNSSHIDMDKLDDLLPDLEAVWPSWSSADETFWDHEWTRHGTCAASVIGGQHAFFRAVLRLHRTLNIQAALDRAGIRPSNSARYPVQDIKDAIEAEYGVMPHVTCDVSGALAEVWMCVNKRLRPIDCVEDPRPHMLARHNSSAAASSDGELAAAPAPPPNYNCHTVRIPKLNRRYGAGAGDEGDEGDDDAAASSSSMQETLADAIEAAAELAEDMADAVADVVGDANGAAFEQQAAAASAAVKQQLQHVVATAAGVHKAASVFVTRMAGSLSAAASAVTRDAQAAAAAAVKAAAGGSEGDVAAAAVAADSDADELAAAIVAPPPVAIVVTAVGRDAAAAHAPEPAAVAAATAAEVPAHAGHRWRAPLLAGGVAMAVAAAVALAAVALLRLRTSLRCTGAAPIYNPVSLDDALEQVDADDTKGAGLFVAPDHQPLLSGGKA